MPSWNIHTAHVECLLADCQPGDLGIDDANAFLFGNYVPDIYLGFVVPEPSFRLDYCMTHMALPNVIPVPDFDRFWDSYIAKPRRLTPTGLSLLVGTWAHLAADAMYNSQFRVFCETCDTPDGEELRTRKQADFDLFGHSLDISMRVAKTPELLEAAQAFRPYEIGPVDVARAIDVADGIVQQSAVSFACNQYQLLDYEWMTSTFKACNDLLATWLKAWRSLYAPDQHISAAAVRAEAGLPSARQKTA